MSKLILSPSIKTRENKRWDWTSDPAMPQGQANVCAYIKCGKIFSEPIELTVRAEGSHETYYACPHCFSRVSKAPHGALRDASEGNEKNDVAGCGHFPGYLKTRPKDSPIPDECLTCSRILKCM